MLFPPRSCLLAPRSCLLAPRVILKIKFIKNTHMYMYMYMHKYNSSTVFIYLFVNFSVALHIWLHEFRTAVVYFHSSPFEYISAICEIIYTASTQMHPCKKNVPFTALDIIFHPIWHADTSLVCANIPSTTTYKTIRMIIMKSQITLQVQITGLSVFWPGWSTVSPIFSTLYI